MAGPRPNGTVAESTGEWAVSRSVAGTTVSEPGHLGLPQSVNLLSQNGLPWSWPPPGFGTSYLDPRARTQAFCLWMAVKLLLLWGIQEGELLFHYLAKVTRKSVLYHF